MNHAAIPIGAMDADEEQTVRAACATPGRVQFVVEQAIDKKFKHFVKSLGLVATYEPVDLRNKSAAAVHNANCALYTVTIS